jgi:hypothetical protein
MAPVPLSGPTLLIPIADSVRDLIRQLGSFSFQIQKASVNALSKRTATVGPERTMTLNSGAVLALVRLLDSYNAEVHEPATAALRNITALTAAEDAAIEANAIPPLVNLLTSSYMSVLRYSCEAIKNICWTRDSARAIAFGAGAIPLLVVLLSQLPSTVSYMQFFTRTSSLKPAPRASSCAISVHNRVLPVRHEASNAFSGHRTQEAEQQGISLWWAGWE